MNFMTSLDQHRLFRARSTNPIEYQDLTSDPGYFRSGKILFRMKELLGTIESHLEGIKRFDDPEGVYARDAHNPREYLSKDLMKIQIELERLIEPGRIIRPKFRESLKKFRDQFITSLEKVKESKISESTTKQISAIIQSLDSLLLHGIKLQYKSILQHPHIQQLAANLQEVKKLHDGGDLLASKKKLTELDRASTLLANRADKASNPQKRVLKQKLLEAESSFEKLIKVQGMENAIKKIWSKLRAAVNWSEDVSASKYTDHSRPKLLLKTIRENQIKARENQIKAAEPVRLLNKRVATKTGENAIKSIGRALNKYVDFFTKLPRQFMNLAFTNLDSAEYRFVTHNNRSAKPAVYSVLKKFNEARTKLAAV